MKNQDQLNKLVSRFPRPRRFFGERPLLSRRGLFQLGAGVTAAMMARPLVADPVVSSSPVRTLNKAKNVIFILMTGAPSHTDTFDYKQSSATPVAQMKPETINGLVWPTGVLPKLAAQSSDIAIVRSARAWALVHGLGQTWTQIGRNPVAALGDIAPNIGSIVALEKAADRNPNQTFPPFLAFNAQAIGSGYLDSAYAPFKTTPLASGLRNTSNVDGQARLNERWSLLHGLDDNLRVKSPLGKPLEDMESFYQAAKGLTYNPIVDQAFKFSAADSARYGSSAFGNSCLVAKQVLAANQGTRFIQLSVGNWDMHNGIYDGTGNSGGIFALGNVFDAGLSALLADLKSSGLLNETLVVWMGEFGRTVGRLSAQGGRDHFPQQFVGFAGAGVKGGRAIGSTNADGSATLDPGWSRGRDVKPEDVEATIYSALGINWTSVRYDDPFGRGFEYVPFAQDDVYGPIEELWS